jgi:hypothetical protein
MSHDGCCLASRNPSGADISYMEQLLAEIEKAGVQHETTKQESQFACDSSQMLLLAC